MYSFGGLAPESGDIIRDVRRLNLNEGGSCQLPSPMLRSRHEQGSLKYNGKFHVFGGYAQSEDLEERVLNSVECYCPSSDEWHEMPPMLQPRKNPKAVVTIGRKNYIVDGVHNNRDGEESELLRRSQAVLEPWVERYDPPQQTWQELPPRPGPYPVNSWIFVYYSSGGSLSG